MLVSEGKGLQSRLETAYDETNKNAPEVFKITKTWNDGVVESVQVELLEMKFVAADLSAFDVPVFLLNARPPTLWVRRLVMLLIGLSCLAIYFWTKHRSETPGVS